MIVKENPKMPATRPAQWATDSDPSSQKTPGHIPPGDGTNTLLHVCKPLKGIEKSGRKFGVRM